ncbi:MAG: hypothetical protein H6791_01085 [Candidatus Nomurabacteria bacterium]|nr:MAG: hypothetical protein H6791_01085 [Candidatus Nomurabacteria bacterium]
MYTVDIITVDKRKGSDTLSYFGDEYITPGSVVEIPIRNKKYLGVVVSSKKVSESKTDIKRSSFALKKHGPIIKEGMYSKNFMTLIERLSEYYFVNQSEILPNIILKNCIKKEASKEVSTSSEINGVEGGHGFVLQSKDEERLHHYKRAIREMFAKGKSVMFVCPKILLAEKYFEELKKGISEYSFIFHGDVPKKKLLTSFEKTQKEKHPIFIIGTPSLFSIKRDDVGLIILDQEGDKNYRGMTYPYIDAVKMAEFFSDITGARLILGDELISTETQVSLREGYLSEERNLSYKFSKDISKTLIDMKAEDSLRGFDVLSTKTKDLLKKVDSGKKSKTLLYINRLGLFTSLICKDCGSPVKCRICKNNLSMVESQRKERQHVCTKCGFREKVTEDKCQNCDSWNIMPLGIGSERVYEEAKKLLKNTELVLFDRNHITSTKALNEKIKKINDEDKVVVIGTDMSLQFFEKFDHVVIVSLDSIFSQPSYKITEETIRSLIRTQNLAKKELLLQTRNPDEPIIKSFMEGSFANIYTSEIKVREKLDFPPYSRFFKISRTGEKMFLDKEISQFRPRAEYVFGEWIRKRGFLYEYTAIIKVQWSPSPYKYKASEDIDRMIWTLRNAGWEVVSDITRIIP